MKQVFGSSQDLTGTVGTGQDNKDGFCPLCPGTSIPGTLEHMLVLCPALDDKRRLLLDYWFEQT